MNLAVIGTGYVGLVSGTCFAEMGNNVICVDNNPEKLAKLNNGQVTIYEPGLELLYQRNFNQKRLSFTANLKEAVEFAESVFLCLPTPQGEDGSADLTHVIEIAEQIGELLKENSSYKLIVNKSTVPVGTVEKVKEILIKKGSKEFDVASNPEFLREGFAVDDFMKPDRIVIGAESEKAYKLLRSLYEPFVRQGNPIIEMDIKSAEVTKYAANSYLATRITFMNELANFCEKTGANVDLVRKGIGSDTRIGKRFLFPGIGYGGSCFPKDVNALIKTSLDYNSELTLLTLVDKINKEQRLRFFNKIKSHFNNELKGKKFSAWGLAFKPNTDDMREAPSVPIIKMLLEKGARVKAFDPASMENAKFYLNDTIEYAQNMYEALPDSDALLIFTEWNEFRNPDFKKVKSLLKHPLIFDGRNVYDLDDMEEQGFTYYSIGRRTIVGKE
ncbi:UDP-glucose/GDP-mannose dehydrogenase family protein [Ignavibacterium sp.]|uniref:UDP-glucose dehydrogenase family protein n=1 Tax=Ignavibacterium sp. TaxID=2651167 RepID=UPI00307F4EC5